jgi:hypothetical protein
MGIPYKPTSHESFSHDSLDSLGYDWERVGDHDIKPKHPFKIYLPQTRDEVVAAVKETRALGQKLLVRSKGHSSNDLVLADRGNVLCIERLNRIHHVDPDGLTARVDAGVVLAELDQHLKLTGHGLPIIGDHNHITAGGFASVGGISPASHRWGLFVDNVEEVEYVAWDGQVVSCSKKADLPGLRRVLCGLGRYGILVALTLRIIKIDKDRTILRNRKILTFNVEKFISRTKDIISSSDDLFMERGVWINMPFLGGHLKMGQFSSYKPAWARWYGALRNRLSYGYLHLLGRWAGRLPGFLESIVKYLGLASVIFSPKYASVRNVESFTDKVLDFTEGDPTRMFILLTPIEEYESVFRDIYELFLEYRKKTGCFKVVAIYVKAIISAYLNQGGGGKFSELMVLSGMTPGVMTPVLLDEIVGKIDAITVRHRGLRYMHTRTVKDEAIRRKIDPNAAYARGPGDDASKGEGA